MKRSSYEPRSGLGLGRVSASAGSRQDTSIRVLQLADGSWVTVPITGIAGARPGPILYIGGGVHGDEINSVEIVHRVVRRISADRLAGAVVCVPVQNPLAFRDQFRVPLGPIIKSPMDQMYPSDMWTCFPGDPQGNSAQRMASALFNALLGDVDVVIDLHTPTTGGKYAPFIFLPPAETGTSFAHAMRLAQAMGPDFILNAASGPYVQQGALPVAMARRGVPALGFEVGEGGRLEEDAVQAGVRCVLNAVRSLEMVEDAPEPLSASRVVRSMTSVRCQSGGILHLACGLGDEVSEGDLVARVTGVFGDVAEEIRAPHKGPLMRMTTFPVVASGERVAQIGVEAS